MVNQSKTKAVMQQFSNYKSQPLVGHEMNFGLQSFKRRNRTVHKIECIYLVKVSRVFFFFFFWFVFVGRATAPHGKKGFLFPLKRSEPWPSSESTKS